LTPGGIIVYCIHSLTVNPGDTFEKEEKVMLTTKRPVMPVKPERSRMDRIEEVDAFLSAR
jgi:hypothetical protein